LRDPSTSLIHHSYLPPEGFESPQLGVFKASTVFFPNVEAMRQFEWKDKSAYTYGLHGTPTTYTLEERLSTLESGKQCLLVPSGLASIANVYLSILKSGDEVLIPDNVYGPNKALVLNELSDWGINHQFYDPMDCDDLEKKINKKTRLVWLEAAGSLSLEFPNLIRLVEICKSKNILTGLDNTWGAGLAFSAFDLKPGYEPKFGVDISVHALTKYPSGGGDVLMGSVITCDEKLHMQLKLTHMRMGWNVGANDAELILRSLPTIGIRYKVHDQTTRSLLQWALKQDEFVQVLHPSLLDSPGHHYWKILTNGDLGTAAGLFSLMLSPSFSQRQVDEFCESLNLFKLGYSWGGPISLVMPYEFDKIRKKWPPYIKRGHLVRFSVGLELAEDLQSDLEQALQKLKS